jgi:DNA-binding transcriptional MerR regulator
MLHNISQVSEQFGVSKRTIQLWCKAEGIKKIGNEYQLTDEIVDRWESTKAKSENENKNKTVTHRNAAKISFTRSFILQVVLVVWILFSIIVIAYLYNDLKNEIEKRYDVIVEHKKELQTIRNEFQDITIQKDNEIQSLKKKIVIDSMIMQRPYFNRRLKN